VIGSRDGVVLLKEKYEADGRRIRGWGKVDLKRIEGKKGQYKARIMRKGMWRRRE
jgi:hypothetical protein